MKYLVLLLALCAFNASANTSSVVTLDTVYDLYRGSSKIGTCTSPADCDTKAKADAEARKASANYTFRLSHSDAVTYSVPPPPPPPAASVCPCSAWASTATPTVPADSDTGAVTLGVKFKSDISGFITGVRFYKGPGNTGTHIGALWSSAGALLASAPFTSETASGWQQVNFSSPVAITANTVYVASYFAPNGHYAGDNNFFATAGVDRPPIHLLRDGVNGGNGVYRYGPASSFPVSTWQASNYWVDVVFTVGASPPPPPPPTTSQAKLTWVASASSGVAGYRVYYGTTPQSYAQPKGAGISTGNVVTYTVPSLLSGRTYYFAVTAVDAGGLESVYSNEVSKVFP